MLADVVLSLIGMGDAGIELIEIIKKSTILLLRLLHA